MLIVHKEHQRIGIGSEALRLLKEKILNNNIRKVSLCVQNGNDSGAAFWNKKGFININTSTDEHGNQTDIYEKEL